MTRSCIGCPYNIDPAKLSGGCLARMAGPDQAERLREKHFSETYTGGLSGYYRTVAIMVDYLKARRKDIKKYPAYKDFLEYWSEIERRLNGENESVTGSKRKKERVPARMEP